MMRVPDPGPAILLATLGRSSMIVLEAALRPGRDFTEVHVFTGDHPEVTTGELERWFKNRPGTQLRVTRLSGFSSLETQADHDTFEEGLLRWYLELAEVHGPAALSVCIAGGFKSMSSALHRAATLFGAGEVFHVLAQTMPPTPAAVESAIAADEVNFIDLGAEAGWPSLRRLGASSFPLSAHEETGAIRTVFPADPGSLRGRILKEQSDTFSAARAWGIRDAYPFPALALLPPQARHWLQQPLDALADLAWIRALPKIELHCHLGGFATQGEPLARIRAAADAPPLAWPAPPPPPAGWPLPASPIALDAYMRLGDANGSGLLRDPACLRAQVHELYRSLEADNIRYAEIRCSPANYATAGRDAWTVLQDIRDAFRTARRDALRRNPAAPLVNLIIIVNRRQEGDLSSISRHLALAVTAAGHEPEHPEGGRICAVDLAGFENRETRAALFQADFDPAHRCGLAVTVHAGENDDVEGIWQAVFKLNARRIGHGLKLADSPDLLRSVVERRIGIEMCPYANYQIHGFKPMAGLPGYPLADYLRAGVPVSVNTDNPGISGASLADNFALLARLCPGMTRFQLVRTLRHALSMAFLTQTERAPLERAFNAAIAPAILAHLD